MFNKNKNPFFHYYYKNRDIKTPGPGRYQVQSKITKTKTIKKLQIINSEKQLFDINDPYSINNQIKREKLKIEKKRYFL